MVLIRLRKVALTVAARCSGVAPSIGVFYQDGRPNGGRSVTRTGRGDSYMDAYDVYGTSARSILMFVLRFVIYISRICPSCRQQLERMGFRVHPLWGVQTKNNNKGIWMPDPVGHHGRMRDPY